MDNVNERLLEIIADLGISKNQFALRIGTSSAMISKITKQKVNFGIDILQKIISAYPHLNQQWLLTGIGEKWNENHNQKPHLSTRLNNNLDKNQQEVILTKENHDEFYNKDYVYDPHAPFYLERHAQKKVYHELLKGDNERARLFQNIHRLMTFQYIIINLDHHYFENIDKRLHEVSHFYDGKDFDFEGFRNKIMSEIDKYLDFNPALEPLVKAIETFYKSAKKIDTKNVIEGYLNG